MINLTPEEKAEIFRMNQNYKMLYNKLDEISSMLEKLKENHTMVSSLLDEAREDEKELINKLEEKYDTKITSNILLEALGIELYK